MAAETVIAGDEKIYLNTARALYETAHNEDESVRLRNLARVRDILDLIVAEYPASDIAARIMLKDQFGKLDITELDRTLSATKSISADAKSGAPDALVPLSSAARPPEVQYIIGTISEWIVIRHFKHAEKEFGEVISYTPTGLTLPSEYAVWRDVPGAIFRVTLAEGATSWRAWSALKMADFLEFDLTEVPSEGSLAPGTYETELHASASELVERMQTEQSVRLNRAWLNRAKGLPFATQKDALTLASIIEKEAANNVPKELIASVFVNRLSRGIRLQSRPTTLYGQTRGRVDLAEHIFLPDFRLETPFNTFAIDYLPPAPISNPGFASLLAATNPASSEYLSFRIDRSGEFQFAPREEQISDCPPWRNDPSKEVPVEPKIKRPVFVELSKYGRMEVQRRLILLDFDLGDVDGNFGPRTKAAISAWQKSTCHSPTGELTLVQYVRLRKQSQKHYVKRGLADDADHSREPPTDLSSEIAEEEYYLTNRYGVDYQCRRLTIGGWCLRATD